MFTVSITGAARSEDDLKAVLEGLAAAVEAVDPDATFTFSGGVEHAPEEGDEPVKQTTLNVSVGVSEDAVEAAKEAIKHWEHLP